MNQQTIDFGCDVTRPIRIAAQAVSVIERAAILNQWRNTHPDNSARSKCNRILAALQRLGSVTTIECTRYLDVVHPPRRVMELRERGHEIDTTWVHHPTECGKVHRVGMYVLKGG